MNTVFVGEFYTSEYSSEANTGHASCALLVTLLYSSDSKRQYSGPNSPGKRILFSSEQGSIVTGKA